MALRHTPSHIHFSFTFLYLYFVIFAIIVGLMSLPLPSNFPSDLEAKLPRIVVDRHGLSEQAYMTTVSVDGHIDPGFSYTLSPIGLMKGRRDNGRVGEKEATLSTTTSTTPPPHLRLPATWIDNDDKSPTEANILGGFGKLIISAGTPFHDGDDGQNLPPCSPSLPLSIPTVEATQESLAYYGAEFIQHGESVSFKTEDGVSMPVMSMHIGKDYVKDYLSHETLGGGVQLEYHALPHFHMPQNQNASGALCLAKKLQGEEESVYLLTGLRIPYGSAIHTPGEVLHNDGFLIGNYSVIYSCTEHFSTVVLRQASGALQPIQMLPETE